MQKYQPKKYRKNKKIIEFIVDETEIKDGSELIWLWVVIEPNDKEILVVDISKERNTFVAERFLSHVLDKYGKHQVSSEMVVVVLVPTTCLQVLEPISSSSLFF